MNSFFAPNVLDDSIRDGLQGMSESFLDIQANFAADCQEADGGFRGRQGSSDLYYTDFALRCLSVLAPGHAALERAKDYLERMTSFPRSIVEIFSLLNVRRMIHSRSAEEIPSRKGAARVNSAVSLRDIKERLDRHLLPSGGFSRFLGDGRVSAYQTFLGGLCFRMLGEELPSVEGAVRALQALKRPDGGYAEMDGQSASQTSATAAAVAFLSMHNVLMPEQSSDTVDYFAKMQSADGGLKAHDAVDRGDLLSTFTGSIALVALNGLNSVKTAGIAEFLRKVACADGGFAACPGDDAPDVEYTYYGLGTLAVLRTIDTMNR
jgi:geranylgeranyl transferase type-2 subunit beta